MPAPHKILDEKTIADLQDEKYSLVTDSQAVENIIYGEFGCLNMPRSFGGFLVSFKPSGEYDEVWGFLGNIPYSYKRVYRIQ